MKPTLALLLAAVLLTSCTQYQYLTVSGVNVSKNEYNELISENDTMRVEYRFTQENGFVTVRLYNKTNAPLEVEWRKSAIIIDDRTVGYYDGKQSINGQIESSSWQFARRTSTSGDLKGEIQTSEQVQFIPPQSYVESRPLAIPLSPLPALPEEKAEHLSFHYSGENAIKYKRFPFEFENAPAKFRSYLTLRMGKTGSQQEFSVEHLFYVSEIWKSNSGPQFFDVSLLNRSDRFYLAR
ncbi:MAG TPA: hypothetical protein VGN63_00650 [Flavisolibacter sp.]|jgi:hypothetical protein|nr:hypothetical protein [Flavisolibacter sp.]